MNKGELAKELLDAEHQVRSLFSRNGVLGSSVSSEVKTLRIIKDNNGQVYPSDISKELGVTTPRITTILNKMENEGLIERKITNFDRRKVAVTLTEKGEEFCNKIREQEYEKINQVIDRLGEKEIKTVIKYFTVFEEVYSK